MKDYTTDKIIAEIQKEKCFKLRLKTGLGLMSCKECLIDNDWDLEEAEKNHMKYAFKKHITYDHSEDMGKK